MKQTDNFSPLFFQFLSQDLPLFEGIVSDLFPGITLPSPDHGVLEEALKRNIKKMGLQAVPWFVNKVIQVRSKFNAVFTSKGVCNTTLGCPFTFEQVFKSRKLLDLVERNSLISLGSMMAKLDEIK